MSAVTPGAQGGINREKKEESEDGRGEGRRRRGKGEDGCVERGWKERGELEAYGRDVHTEGGNDSRGKGEKVERRKEAGGRLDQEGWVWWEAGMGVRGREWT
uniref:Uncharacterized protein n=1 Tax=Heliothis virescens TaxID=7102 RepID=A0A2A4J6R3_HELVI